MWHTSSTEGLDPLFIQLDKESKKLRDTAKDFASYLMADNMDLPKKDDLIKALQYVSSVRIDRIDVAISSLEKALLAASIKLKDPKIKNIPGQEKNADTLIIKSTAVIKEMGDLLNKAIELSKKGK